MLGLHKCLLPWLARRIQHLRRKAISPHVVDLACSSYRRPAARSPPNPNASTCGICVICSENHKAANRSFPREKKNNPSDSRTLKSDWFSYVFVWRYVVMLKLPEPPSPLWLWHGINTGVAARSHLAKLSCSNKYWQSCLLLLADLKLIFAFRLTRWRKYSFFLISLPLIVEAETFCTVFFFEAASSVCVSNPDCVAQWL